MGRNFCSVQGNGFRKVRADQVKKGRKVKKLSSEGEGGT